MCAWPILAIKTHLLTRKGHKKLLGGAISEERHRGQRWRWRLYVILCPLVLCDVFSWAPEVWRHNPRRAWHSWHISFPTSWPHRKGWAARQGRRQPWTSTMKALGPLAPQAEGLLVLPTVPGEVVCSLAGFNIAQTMYYWPSLVWVFFWYPSKCLCYKATNPQMQSLLSKISKNPKHM